jgi:hypothetical protein
MSSGITTGNPKREILVDARKELQLANKLLKNNKDVDSAYAKMHIEMALHLINGLVNTLEPPEQTYSL